MRFDQRTISAFHALHPRGLVTPASTWDTAGVQLRDAIAVMGVLALVGCGGAPAPATPDDDTGTTGGQPGSEGSSGAGTVDDTGTGNGIPEPAPAECEGQLDSLIFQGASDHEGELSGLQHLAMAGDMVYGCAEQGGLAGWNIADLLDPQRVTSDPAGADAVCTAVTVSPDGTRVILARTDAVELYAVDDPAAPQLLSSVDVADVADLVVTDDDTVFAAAGGAVHAITRATDTLMLVGTTMDPSDARAVAWSASTGLWVADGRGGLRRYVLDGDSLGPAGSVPINGVAVDVAVQDDEVYVASLEGVSSIDASDPANPALVSDRSSPGAAMAVAPAGAALWLADWERLRAMDPTAGAGLAFVGDEPLVTSTPQPRVAALAADADRLVAAHWNGVRTYVPCPTQPPALWPELDGIDFRTVPVTNSQTRVLVLRNNGAQPLQIQSLTATDPAFTVSDTPVTVAPGAGEAIEIAFAPDSEAEVVGELVIASDDPDEPELRVPLTGNVLGAQLGDPAVPFHAIDTEGRSWRPQDAQGDVVLLAYFATW